MAGYIPRWFTCPQTVTHPCINRAWRRVTSLITTNALPLSQTTNHQWSQLAADFRLMISCCVTEIYSQSSHKIAEILTCLARQRVKGHGGIKYAGNSSLWAKAHSTRVARVSSINLVLVTIKRGKFWWWSTKQLRRQAEKKERTSKWQQQNIMQAQPE